MRFDPTKKGEGAKVFLAILKGGGAQIAWGSLTREHEVLGHTRVVGGGGGGGKFYTLSRGDAKSVKPMIFLFCSHPPPPRS